MGAGLLLSHLGRQQEGKDRAAEEIANAEFLREQSDFAEKAGERAREIFDRESLVLYSEQQSSLTKAGVDTGFLSTFMAGEMLSRQKESYAIKLDADFNARLGRLRADQSLRRADSYTDQGTQLMQTFTQGLMLGGSVFGGK